MLTQTFVLITECASGNFQCLNGRCIDSSALCDGIHDCPGGEDETLNCSKLSFIGIEAKQTVQLLIIWVLLVFMLLEICNGSCLLEGLSFSCSFETSTCGYVTSMSPAGASWTMKKEITRNTSKQNIKITHLVNFILIM